MLGPHAAVRRQTVLVALELGVPQHNAAVLLPFLEGRGGGGVPLTPVHPWMAE